MAEQTTVDAPVPKPKAPAVDPHAAKPEDRDAVAAWRQRLGTDDAQVIDRERAATAEGVNAPARHRGLQQLRVGGRTKGRNVLLFHALAHNLMRTLALAPEVLGLGTAAPDMAVMTR